MDTTVLTWLLAGVATIVGTLSTVIVTLWRITEARHKETKLELTESRRRHDECEVDRLAIHKQLAGLAAIVKERGDGMA